MTYNINFFQHQSTYIQYIHIYQPSSTYILTQLDSYNVENWVSLPKTFREVGTSRDQGNLLFFSFQQSVVVSQSQSVRQSQSLVSLSKSLSVAIRQF